MKFDSINPATSRGLASYLAWDDDRLEAALEKVPGAAEEWSRQPAGERAKFLRATAGILRGGREGFARLITLEMGKLIGEARQEIDKCAWTCDYFADHAERFLADEHVETEAARSYVAHRPLGTVLAVMPWNFPFWQVFRAGVPALLAGNTLLLKHAPNVMGCAFAIEQVFRDAGLPFGTFLNLPITVRHVARLLADQRIHGVSFTGGVCAGREIARQAGANLKKAVLELGGSDPFIVLEDADLESTVPQAVFARFFNAGQSCIAAKRFIVVEAVADDFVERFKTAVEKLQPGDPLDAATTLAPLARADLRDALHRQVSSAVAVGAVPVIGCAPVEGRGNYYQASMLDRARPGMAVFDEEVFGPVAAIIRVKDEEEAVNVANLSRFGLGGSVWTGDNQRGEGVARRLQCGMGFVNAVVRSDPRLPCGGIRDSGFGRELSHHGMREFTNLKTIWIE